MASKFPTMPYLLYCVVYFKVQGTMKEVFMAEVRDAALANHKVFTCQYAHDAKVASSHPSPIMIHIAHNLS
jgi:hypothetical protein